MADYPLIFTLTHEIRCPNFSARVVSRGRALMTVEDGLWWCHGVEPGSLTEQGADPAVAFAAFKEALGEILQDLASDASGFKSFERSVQEFIVDVDAIEAQRWEAARTQITSGAQIETFFDRLPRETRDIRAHVRVEQIDHIVPAEENVVLAKAA